MWSFPNEFYASRLNVLSKRHSKDLATVVTRRGSCLSVRDCYVVCCWLSVAYAFFDQPLSQWLCRREGNFYDSPITWELMCHTHTLHGNFFFTSLICLLCLMSDFCCVVVSSTVTTGLFLFCQNRFCRCQFRFELISSTILFTFSHFALNLNQFGILRFC